METYEEYDWSALEVPQVGWKKYFGIGRTEEMASRGLKRPEIMSKQLRRLRVGCVLIVSYLPAFALFLSLTCGLGATYTSLALALTAVPFGMSALFGCVLVIKSADDVNTVRARNKLVKRGVTLPLKEVAVDE